MTDVSGQIDILINKMLVNHANGMMEYLMTLSQTELSAIGLTKEDIENGDITYIILQLHLAKLLINWQLNGMVNGSRESGQSLETVLKNPVSANFVERANHIMTILQNPFIDAIDKYM